jgi:hypothetical protein
MDKTIPLFPTSAAQTAPPILSFVTSMVRRLPSSAIASRTACVTSRERGSSSLGPYTALEIDRCRPYPRQGRAGE